MKFLLKELPTIEFYKVVKPDIYNSLWNCLYCNTNESFHHLWTCSERMDEIITIIDKTKRTLENTVHSVYTNLSTPQRDSLNKILDYNS